MPSYKIHKIVGNKRVCRRCLQDKDLETLYKKIVRGGKTYYPAICKICSEIERKEKQTEEQIVRGKEYSKNWHNRRKELGIKYIPSEEVKERRRQYVRNRNLDISFNLRTRYRHRLLTALNSRNLKKKTRTWEYLGCSKKELVEYIESLFLPDMSWENRNLWHVDHIKPCCSFDLSDDEQVRKCFHYTNLRPLWAKDNLAKVKDDLKQRISG